MTSITSKIQKVQKQAATKFGLIEDLGYDDKPGFEALVEKKFEGIQNSSSETEKVLRRTARQIVLDRSRARFFDDAYKLRYSDDVLAQRPFLNIGPGSFRHKRWRVADKSYGGQQQSWTELRRGVEQSKIDHPWDIYERVPLDLPDSSLQVIYCSHVIEHLFPEDVMFLFTECRRMLAPNGTLRLVCPDADLLVRAYDDEDWGYFMYYLSVMTARVRRQMDTYSHEELRLIGAKFLLDWVSLLTHPENPDRLSAIECVEFIASFPTTWAAIDAASKMSPKEINKNVGAHVNWFNADKLQQVLRHAGFETVQRSSYLQSRCVILRDNRYFDRTDCEMSLYMEAVA